MPEELSISDLDPAYATIEREIVEGEQWRAADAQFVVKAIERLVSLLTTDERYLVRCDEIGEAVVAISKGRTARLRDTW
jgi:hypothetical protein